VHIGCNAGLTSQDQAAIAIGINAGRTNQSVNAIAIGEEAGETNQLNNSIAIGHYAGERSQNTNAVAIGHEAGRINQNIETVAIGHFAGQTDQSGGSIAIGYHAGSAEQDISSVAIGYEAGKGPGLGLAGQGNSAIAIGSFAGAGASGVGLSAQAANAIAIGSLAGNRQQATNAIAIGVSAGQTRQGRLSIAIGNQAGTASQTPNSIIINATGTALNNSTLPGGQSTWQVAPVRRDISDNILYYHTSTNEITYGIVPLNTQSDNFTFGMKFQLTNTVGVALNRFWLFPGSHYLRDPQTNISVYQNNTPPPSMAIGYSTATINTVAVHLTQTISGAGWTPLTGTVEIGIQWFCEVRDDGFPDGGGGTISSVGWSNLANGDPFDKRLTCGCYKFEEVNIGCAPPPEPKVPLFLGVWVDLGAVNTLAVGHYNISVTINTSGPSLTLG